MQLPAGVAELVDAPDLGSGWETSAGSSPVSGTCEGEMTDFEWDAETPKKCTLAASWPLLRSNISGQFVGWASMQTLPQLACSQGALQSPLFRVIKKLRGRSLAPAIPIHPPYHGEPISGPQHSRGWHQLPATPSHHSISLHPPGSLARGAGWRLLIHPSRSRSAEAQAGGMGMILFDGVASIARDKQAPPFN